MKNWDYFTCGESRTLKNPTTKRSQETASVGQIKRVRESKLKSKTEEKSLLTLLQLLWYNDWVKITKGACKLKRVY